MKKALFFVALLFIAGCGTSANPVNAELGENINITNGSTVVIAGEPLQSLHIRFDGIMEDSRCPEGLQCYWAGNAKAKITVNKTECYLILRKQI